MQTNGEICQTVPLFQGLEPREIEGVLSCLQSETKRAAADAFGNRTILTKLSPGELFGETFACASGDKKTLPVTVIAEEPSVIMLVDYHKIITTCASACRYHTQLIENMLAILADKNWMLNRRIEHLSKRTTRDKLLSFLEEQALLKGSREFSIPFDRQELADYLCVERSAMSAVLGKLRDEGYLTFHRSRFRLNTGMGE